MAINLIGNGRLVSRAPFLTGSRFTHRSSSSDYMNLWRTHRVRYPDVMPPNMREFTNLVERILSIESTIKVEGKHVPFVHAMPAGSKVMMELYKRAVPLNDPYQLHLRSPYSRAESREELWKKIPKRETHVARGDFLSMSPALTCNTIPYESAAWWGFHNHNGGEGFLRIEDHFYGFIDQIEKNQQRKVPKDLKTRCRQLMGKYSNLNVGQFYVLGVPKDKLTDWVYDSNPYSIPTGKEIVSVVARPTLGFYGKGTIATMPLSREVLTPNSGLIAVDATDPLIYREFCKSTELTPAREVEAYRPLLVGKQTDAEAKEEMERNELDKELASVIRDFEEWLNYDTTQSPGYYRGLFESYFPECVRK